MVQSYTFDLINHLRTGQPLSYSWKLPSWLIDNKTLILSKLECRAIIGRYTLYHDIGKPFCLKIDQEGKQHFPNHAKISEEIYRKFFRKDTVVRRLIKYDMDVHLLKSADLDAFCSRREAITSLIVGLAEIHANSSMFGGIDSVSFKIKWKHLNKVGGRIIDKLS